MNLNDYHKHFANLGKFARAYDVGATIDTAALTQTTVNLFDQIATGAEGSIDALAALNGFGARLEAAIAETPGEYRETAVEAARAYLVSAFFTSSLTSVPATPVTAKTVLEALQNEMNVVDAGIQPSPPTLTDESSTGLVNFFNVNFAPSGTWPTVASGGAFLDDTVYVTDTVLTVP